MDTKHTLIDFAEVLADNDFAAVPDPFTIQPSVSTENSYQLLMTKGTDSAKVADVYPTSLASYPVVKLTYQTVFSENAVIVEMDYLIRKSKEEKAEASPEKPESMYPPLRVALLEDAIKLTAGPRNRDYGKPLDNMRNTAEIFKGMTGIEMTPEQAALFLVALKLARLRQTPNHEDSFTDAAAYIAIAFECVLEG